MKSMSAIMAVVLCGLLQILPSAARSPFDYDVVLAIVIVELVFAFGVGLICIIFSYNLFRAIKESESLPHDGNLPSSFLPTSQRTSKSEPPKSEPTQSADYNTFHEGKELPDSLLDEYDSDDYELEKKKGTQREHNGGVVPILKTFTNYLRLW